MLDAGPHHGEAPVDAFVDGMQRTACRASRPRGCAYQRAFWSIMQSVEIQ